MQPSDALRASAMTLDDENDLCAVAREDNRLTGGQAQLSAIYRHDSLKPSERANIVRLKGVHLSQSFSPEAAFDLDQNALCTGKTGSHEWCEAALNYALALTPRVEDGYPDRVHRLNACTAARMYVVIVTHSKDLETLRVARHNFWVMYAFGFLDDSYRELGETYHRDLVAADPDNLIRLYNESLLAKDTEALERFSKGGDTKVAELSGIMLAKFRKGALPPKPKHGDVDVNNEWRNAALLTKQRSKVRKPGQADLVDVVSSPETCRDTRVSELLHHSLASLASSRSGKTKQESGQIVGSLLRADGDSPQAKQAVLEHTAVMRIVDKRFRKQFPGASLLAQAEGLEDPELDAKIRAADDSKARKAEIKRLKLKAKEVEKAEKVRKKTAKAERKLVEKEAKAKAKAMKKGKGKQEKTTVKT